MQQPTVKPCVLVTGANGQLGSELKQIAASLSWDFLFTDVAELDLLDKKAVHYFFDSRKIDYCVNCAAYTAVDKAETDIDMCMKINAFAVENLAQACEANATTLIHISTDFIFDGTASKPLTENDIPNPLSVYGRTKLEGERLALNHCRQTIIIRTSWLYSEFGNNFVKTMIRLAETRPALNVIFDQVGSPTYAADLANAILLIIQMGQANDLKGKYGIYHYSNEGVASWYDFAVAVFEGKKLDVAVLPILTSGYPTPAARPHYSVMDKSKIKSTFQMSIPHWRESLRTCLAKLP